MDRREEHRSYRGDMGQGRQHRGPQMDEEEIRRMRARAREEAWGDWVPEPPPQAQGARDEVRGHGEPFARTRGRRRRRGLIRQLVARLGMRMQQWAEEGGERLSRAGERVEDWSAEGGERLSRAGERVREVAEQPERIVGEPMRPRRVRRRQRGDGDGELEIDLSYRGRGPKNYTRSDERIREDVCDLLAEAALDASDIEVKVDRGEVTLEGSVPTKHWRRMAEDLADQAPGVGDINNDLRVRAHG